MQFLVIEAVASDDVEGFLLPAFIFIQKVSNSFPHMVVKRPSSSLATSLQILVETAVATDHAFLKAYVRKVADPSNKPILQSWVELTIAFLERQYVARLGSSRPICSIWADGFGDDMVQWR